MIKQICIEHFSILQNNVIVKKKVVAVGNKPIKKHTGHEEIDWQPRRLRLLTLTHFSIHTISSKNTKGSTITTLLFVLEHYHHSSPSYINGRNRSWTVEADGKIPATTQTSTATEQDIITWSTSSNSPQPARSVLDIFQVLGKMIN